jgi:DNA-binding MarR family transcriptional regulator
MGDIATAPVDNGTQAPDDEGTPYAQVEQELAVLMRRARAYSLDLARQVHPELQAAAYAMLGRILDLGGARSSNLSDYFGIDKGAVSRQVHLLEQLGLLRREPDPQDGRAQRLVITEEGAERVGRARDQRRRLMRLLLEDWDDGDVAAFAHLLERFNSAAVTRISLPPEPTGATGATGAPE